MTAKSSITVSNITEMAATFTLVLSKDFISDNYLSVGITNAPFEQETSPETWVGESGVLRSNFTEFEYTGTDTVTLRPTLRPGTTYTWYGFAQAANGYYYRVPADGTPITFKTKGTDATGRVEGDGTWKCYGESIGEIAEVYVQRVRFGANEVYRYRVSFTKSGKAKFNLNSADVDVLMCLSTSPDYDSTNGIPKYILDSDDPIVWSVRAGTSYYIWVSAYDTGVSGRTNLVITPPLNEDDDVPDFWDWTQQYELSTGGTGTICADAYVPVNTTGFHPIKATEWNNFTSRIEEVRAYLGYQTKIGFTEVQGESNGYSSPTEFTAKIYNEAAKAIKTLGGNISTIASGQELNAQIFLDLQDQLNAVISKLE